MRFKKITPVLLAEEIESAAKFWTERFGFTKIAEVPEGDKLGFVMLQKDGVELMYQSYASVEKDRKDDPLLSREMRKGPTYLYIEVDSLNSVIAAAKGLDVAMTERTTFYGAKEIGYMDPAGHYIIFAEFAQAAAN
jgi:uncharacterized glyoxalase superfamily protein PhnB